MELGRYLVREFNFEESDTAGRWMSHHLAELILAAEIAPNAAKRSRARASAAETILKIWAQRSSLPARAYPLARYRHILDTLNNLRPDRDNWRWITEHAGSTREKLVGSIAGDLTCLIFVLLLIEMPSQEGLTDLDAAAIEALSDTEEHILSSLLKLGELFLKPTKGVRGMAKTDGMPNEQARFRNLATGFIDRMTASLGSLRSELVSAAPGEEAEPPSPGRQARTKEASGKSTRSSDARQRGAKRRS